MVLITSPLTTLAEAGSDCSALQPTLTKSIIKTPKSDFMTYLSLRHKEKHSKLSAKTDQR
jgi:hypothetical protein